MIYKKYGEVFKKIRKQGGFSLSCFYSVGIAKATLSEFERGISMMSFEKVNAGLQLMDVSLAEFEYLLNAYGMSDSHSILFSVEQALLNENKSELQNLFQEAIQNGWTHIGFAIKILIGEVYSFELEELSELLYTADIWNKKEMFILYTIIDHIAPKDVIYILKNFKAHAKGTYHSLEHQRSLALILFKAIIILSYYGYEKEAKGIIREIESHKIAYSMFLKNLFYGIKGYWVYCFEDKKRGCNMVIKFLEIQELAGQEEVTRYYRKIFDRYIEELRS